MGKAEREENAFRDLVREIADGKSGEDGESRGMLGSRRVQ